MEGQDITFNEIVQGVYASPRMQALLDPTPSLGRIQHISEMHEIFKNLSSDTKRKLESLIEEDRNASENSTNPFYEYYAVLEVSVNGEKKAVLKGYDPYMNENIWYVSEGPESTLQDFKAPTYPMRIDEGKFNKIATTFQFFLNQFKGYKEVDFTIYLFSRENKDRLGQFVQTKRNSNEFVFLPENSFVVIRKQY